MPTQESVQLAQQVRCQTLRDRPSVEFSHPRKYHGAVHSIRTKECIVSTLTFGRRPLGLSAYQSNRPEKDNRRDRYVESRASLRPPPPLLHHNPIAWDATGRDHTNHRLSRAPRGSPGPGDATGECGRGGGPRVGLVGFHVPPYKLIENLARPLHARGRRGRSGAAGPP